MAKFNFSTQMQAIIIGNSSDEFVRHTIDVLGSYELEFSVCPDVYQAVCVLAKTTGKVLIVGRIDQLNREDGRFFRIAGKKKALCCCLADTSSAKQYLRSLSMIGTDAFVINEPAEIEDVVTRLLSVSHDQPRAASHEVRLTSEELDALLGGRGEKI